MTHRYLSHGEDLADVLRDAISVARASNPLSRVTVVTPSYYSSFYLRRWLAAGGLLNVEFVRIEDIADLLASGLVDEIGGRPINRLEGAELVRQAVAQCIRSGTISGRIADIAWQPAFLSSLQRTLRELEAQDVDGRVTFRGITDADEITTAIGNIWTAYRELKLSNSLFDRTQVASAAVTAIESGALSSPAQTLAIGKIIVLAVAHPAPQYRQLWTALTQVPASTTIFATTGDERSDNLMTEAVGMAGAAMAQDINAPVAEVVCAEDVRSEIAAVVSRIAAAAAAGIPFNRIAVLYGNPAYSVRIRSALEFADIPVAGPPQTSLIGSSLGRFISGLLAVIESDLSRSETGDWLASCAIRDPGTKQLVNGVAWDRISKAARITSGAEIWRSQLARFARSKRRRAELIDQHGEDGSNEAHSVRADALRAEAQAADDLLRFINSLEDDVKTPDETASWKTWSNWLAKLTERYMQITTGSEAEDSNDRLTSLLQGISRLDALNSPPPDLEHFASVVARELSDTRSGANRLGRGVFVAPVRNVQGTRFDHVHVVGMVDGTFPSPDAADPLLSDSVRSELNASCRIDLSLSGVRLDEKRRQFLVALMAGSSVTLYWPRGTGSAISGPAQWLVEQVRRGPGMDGIHAEQLLNSPRSLPSVAVVEYASGTDFADGHEYELTSLRQHASAPQSTLKHWLEGERDVELALELERERYFGPLSRWAGDVSRAQTDLPAINEEVLSASRIESFASCPLRYFFAYVLNVNPGVREDSSMHLAPDRRGTLVHSILERYVRLRQDHDKPSGFETLGEAMESVFAESKSSQPDLARAVWTVDTGQITRQLRRWLKSEKALNERGFTPVAAELSFGRENRQSGKESLPALEIRLEDGTPLRFNGVIDRVDGRQDGTAYVLDYKTGSARSYAAIAEDPVDRGRHLQLALYSEAIQLLDGRFGAIQAGYWFVTDSKTSFVPNENEFEPVFARDRLHTVLETLAATNRDGYFPPNPGGSAFGNRGATFENCRFCDFDRVCPTGTRRRRMAQVHSEDPRLSRYFDLALAREGGLD